MLLFKAYKCTFDKELKGNITLKTEYCKEGKWILKNKKQQSPLSPYPYTKISWNLSPTTTWTENGLIWVYRNEDSMNIPKTYLH